MDKQQTIAGNEAIAKFMGGEWHVPNKGKWFVTGDFFTFHDRDKQFFRLEQLRYHFDWNWLMPVVKKVNNTHIFSDKIIIYKPALMNALMENDIKEAWNIVTQVIKLCNENPHQHGT